MKWISLLLFFCSLQAKASDFYLRLYDNSPFTIVFNGANATYGCSYFQANNLASGTYAMEIYNSCMSAYTPCALPIYRGSITIPSGYQIMAYLDMFNRLQSGNTIPLMPANGYITSGTMRPYPGPRWLNLNDSTSYAKAQEIMSGISNVKQKVNFLKYCVYFYGITSQRLSEIMLQFSFDSERLDLASYSFPFTIDRENYYLVYNSLIFAGSRQQLDNSLYYQAVYIR